jgi:hypothetical protein
VLKPIRSDRDDRAIAKDEALAGRFPETPHGSHLGRKPSGLFIPAGQRTGRERDDVGRFLEAEALSPGTFDDAEIGPCAAAIAAEGGL